MKALRLPLLVLALSLPTTTGVQGLHPRTPGLARGGAPVRGGVGRDQQHEDYPGQGEHKEPPRDWMCTTHPSAPAVHRCECKKTCTKNPDGTITEQEDQMPGRCKVWCFPHHCSCPTPCATT